MTISELKEKITQIDYKTGAQKVARSATLVVALMLAGTSVAYASVPAQNIIGDAQISTDRTQIKMTDAQDIRRAFYGFNKYGNQTITMDEIRKAIELSDTLNSYYFDVLDYTNTTKNEVLSLDVDKMYDEYLIAKYGQVDKTTQFCQKHLEDKPALDAYITFACGTVANNLEKSIATKMNSVIESEGRKTTSSPKTIINNGNLYVIVEVEGQTQLIELTGIATADLVSLITNLHYHTDTAVNNIAGASPTYENTFAYNGVEMNTNESVWLSFPDEQKQERIENGIQLYELLEDGYGYEITSEDPIFSRELTKEEKEMLRSLGYDQIQTNNAVRKEALLNKVLEQTYTK
ncbi:MAG: hypothetical protein ACI4XM_07590 [Candidatus Coprovivens sp.]